MEEPLVGGLIGVVIGISLIVMRRECAEVIRAVGNLSERSEARTVRAVRVAGWVFLATAAWLVQASVSQAM